MKLAIRPTAEADLTESISWYRDQAMGLDKEFALAVDKAMMQIRKNPTGFVVRGKISGKQVRAITVSRFPFLIYYYVDEARNVIVVEAIWHTARNPAKWKKRV